MIHQIELLLLESVVRTSNPDGLGRLNLREILDLLSFRVNQDRLSFARCFGTSSSGIYFLCLGLVTWCLTSSTLLVGKLD